MKTRPAGRTVGGRDGGTFGRAVSWNGSMYALLVVVSCLNPAQLGAADYRHREFTERVWRACGLLAVPALLSQRDSADPEVRERVRRLLRPWRNFCADLRAAAVLSDPFPVNALAFYKDEELRYRVKALALACGCTRHYASWITPDTREDCFFRWGQSPVVDAVWGLGLCKKELGTRAGWPID